MIFSIIWLFVGNLGTTVAPQCFKQPDRSVEFFVSAIWLHSQAKLDEIGATAIEIEAPQSLQTFVKTLCLLHGPLANVAIIWAQIER